MKYRILLALLVLPIVASAKLEGNAILKLLGTPASELVDNGYLTAAGTSTIDGLTITQKDGVVATVVISNWLGLFGEYQVFDGAWPLGMSREVTSVAGVETHLSKFGDNSTHTYTIDDLTMLFDVQMGAITEITYMKRNLKERFTDAAISTIEAKIYDKPLPSPTPSSVPTSIVFDDAHTIYEADNLFLLLGEPTTSSKVQAILNNSVMKFIEDPSWGYTSKSTGLILYPADGKISMIYVMVEPVLGYQPFKGELPMNITRNMTTQQVLKAFPKAKDNFGKYWVKYGGCSAFVFMKDGVVSYLTLQL